ncbi:lipid kinase YegS [soil metagenome]
MDPSKKAVLLVNNKSRRGKEWYSQCDKYLRDFGFELEESREFRRVDQLIRHTKNAIGRKVPTIIAGGGDGTFSAIAKLFENSESTLGVLPLGTGNAFARDLGIATDPETACRVVAEGKRVKVDLGVGAGDVFLNVATMGLTTLVADSLTNDAKRRLGMFVYAAALFNGIRKAKPFLLTLETENDTDEFETLQLVIGNGRYHAGPFPLSPGASIVEGKLSLYALQTTNKAAFLKLGLYLPSGRQCHLPEVHYQDTSGGIATTTPSVRVTIDGEISANTPFKFGIRPGCLPVMVPQSFVESEIEGTREAVNAI